MCQEQEKKNAHLPNALALRTTTYLISIFTRFLFQLLPEFSDLPQEKINSFYVCKALFPNRTC